MKALPWRHNSNRSSSLCKQTPNQVSLLHSLHSLPLSMLMLRVFASI